MAYSQANRPLKVETALGPDALLASSISGVEGVSMPFHFVLDLLSEDDSVSADALLRKPAVIRITLADRGEREIHGLVSRFVQLGKDEDLVHYEAEIVPWLWFLSLSRDCKIFQEKSVLEIVEQVFKDQGYSDFEIRCTRSYPKRGYCVQYRETHLDFVSRLLEEEGIFYFFEHSADKHTLVLSDTSGALEPCPGGSTGRLAVRPDRDEDVVTSLRQEHSVHIGSVALRNYDYLQPSLMLHGSRSGAGKEEVYDYLGGFTTKEEGERYARQQLEAEEALRQMVRGEGSCRSFQSGFRMSIKEHYRRDVNRDYLLLQVQHSASVGDYRTSDPGPFDYRNQFLAIPHDVPFRPVRRTPKARVLGSQTALVVGPSGEEIYVDKYGRVKVQFYWDRDGQKDEHSSCWVRVASHWAGKQWGAIQIPRIGQEVIVDFLDGDPDRPIITGRVYNAELMPPYELPANMTQSGIKSRSTKGAGAANFNEIRFEDKKDAEQFYIHAEKNLDAVIENNETRKIGYQKKDKGDQTIEVFNNRKLVVGGGAGDAADGSDTSEVFNNQVVKVGTGAGQAKDGSQTIEVFKNQSLKVGTAQSNGSQTVKIYKDQTVTLETGNQTTTLKMGNQETKLDMGNQKTVLKMGNQDTTLSMGNRTVKLNLGKSSEEAMQAIELKVGASSIKIDQTGVTIKGMMVKIDGTMMTEVKGLMTQVNGSAMLKMGGGITMIG